MPTEEDRRNETILCLALRNLLRLLKEEKGELLQQVEAAREAKKLADSRYGDVCCKIEDLERFLGRYDESGVPF